MKKRYAHNLSHTETSTLNMGTCIPCNIIEVFPGDSFKIQAKDLTRFLPQVAPTMHDVFVGIDTYQVPLRQLCDKLRINWDDYLTGGEDGTIDIENPMITIPEGGYEPGSLADFLGYPTNWTDPETAEKHIVAVGQQFSAWPVLAYMHIINENYRDQNFLQKFDFTKYQEFLDGTYEFKDEAGNVIDYDLQREGLFPKAWSRDYYGKALPNTQRGVEAKVPLGESAVLSPTYAPIASSYTSGANTNYSMPMTSFSLPSRVSGRVWTLNFNGSTYTATEGQYGTVLFSVPTGTLFYIGQQIEYVLSCSDVSYKVSGVLTTYSSQTSSLNGNFDFVRISGNIGAESGSVTADVDKIFVVNSLTSSAGVVNLNGVVANLADSNAASIIAFRTAARMQQFGEALQQAGARAVEYTMKFFGVRIPDGRIQRPLFHGSFRMPVIFSEVLQTSQTTDTSTLATLGGHGITGGVNRPIHVKVIEHGFVMSIMHVMPRSQFQNIVPKYLLRKNRFDLPNPIFQGTGEQAIKRIEIYPETANPDENFGYVPQFSELMNIPSTLHGHMKDTFLHWTMARVYSTEPVLSAKWRYERPSDRSFAVQNEDQMQVCIGFEIHARRVFNNRPRPGIHIV